MHSTTSLSQRTRRSTIPQRSRPQRSTLAKMERTCLLTPVHEPHFAVLARRLRLTSELAAGSGPRPTTVIVFDDAAAGELFCARFGEVCDSHVIRLHLRGLIGAEAYDRARVMLKSPYRPAPSMTPAGATCRGRVISKGCLGCRWKAAGRCYQSLKKFYGVAYGPERCQHVLVSDAEGFPFRRFWFDDWAARMARQPPYQLISSWFPSSDASSLAAHALDDLPREPHLGPMRTGGSGAGHMSDVSSCSSYRHDEHTDPSCALKCALKCYSWTRLWTWTWAHGHGRHGLNASPHEYQRLQLIQKCVHVMCTHAQVQPHAAPRSRLG